MQKKTRYLHTSLATIVLTLLTALAQADDDRVRDLERTVKQRDRVILELLERVEALERRVGVRSQATEPAAATRDQAEVPTPLETESSQGNAGAPGSVVVEEDAAERALERSLTREGLLLLPSGRLEIEPRLSYARNEDSTPGFVMNGVEIFASETERNVDNFTADLAMRLGLPWDTQLEIGLPYRWREIESVTNLGFAPTRSSSVSGSGPGDLRIGLAKTLFRENLWLPDVVGRLTWDTDTGDQRDGNVALGGGFNELQGSITVIKREDPIAFVGGLSYQHSFEQDEIQPGAILAANFGGFLALSPETSLRLLIAGALQQETEISGREIDGSDRTIATLIIGGSTLLAPGTLLNLSAGIGLTDDADDFSISVSVPIRVDERLF